MRCECVVDSVTMYPLYAAVVMTPEVCRSPDNEKFFNFTPAGEIKLEMVNKEISDKFIPGKTVFIDFTPKEDAL